MMNILFVLSTLAALANADGTYRSRPDLSPPKLNITLPCGSTHGKCDEGYIFVSPFTTYGEPDDRVSLQAGPYILTNTGDLVWSGIGYFAGWSCNLQAARFQGRDVLFSFEGTHNGNHGHGHGHHTILDQSYGLVKTLRGGGNRISDKHEFIIVGESSALIQIYHPLQRDLSLYGGEADQTWIVDAKFQELDIETGKVLFEWSSLDHVSPYESALPLPSGLAGVGRSSATAWDYFHINSLAKGADGHYLLSARHASTIYKINGTDGSIIWQLGGKNSSFSLGENVQFGFQHHARYHFEDPTGKLDTLSLFDNSVYGSESAGEGKQVRINPYSSGKYIQLDHVKNTATLVKRLEPVSVLGQAPGDAAILTKSQGSLQSLPRGGDFVNWGSEGQITEYGADGKAVFHAFLGRGWLRERLQNYRAFRYEWKGISPEEPAIFAEESPITQDGTLRLFVSWNGDTITKSWRFSWTERGMSNDVMKTTLKEKLVDRSGFETSVSVERAAHVQVGSVRAEALDAEGRILATTSFIGVQQVLPKSMGTFHEVGSYQKAM